MTDHNTQPVLSVKNLGVSFRQPDGSWRAVTHGVSLTIEPGRSLALVGESGCGKSVTALAILRLLPGSARIDNGRVMLDSADGTVDLRELPPAGMRRVRGRDVAIIFQEPRSSLNPVMRIGEQVIEAVRLHRSCSRSEAKRAAMDLLADAEIPSDRFAAYPHELSGGLCQRVMIAMALAQRPRLLIADEPTTALDVTTQARILSLLDNLRTRHGMALLLITHDLGIVAQHADEASVMYAGRIVEHAPTPELFANPLHPYTRGLLACLPRLDRRVDRLDTVDRVLADPASVAPLPPPPPRSGEIPWWPTATGEPNLVEIGPNHRIAVRQTHPART
jgi:ABC-type dipeptide/oligopeptide/nickel transport system ATPase component